MGRYYHMSKAVSPEEKEEILREIRTLKNLKSVEITENNTMMKVETVDGVFQDVMNGAVNICRKVAGGCELSFVGFAEE